MPNVQPRPLFSKLESLRGVAACLVAIHHSPFLVGDQSAPFVGSSYLFVDYFFILSGFVITYAYRAKILSGMRFKAYASLRIGRLVPVHVFAHFVYAFSIFGKWLVYLLGIGASNPAEWVHVPSFFTNLFLLQAFGVYDYLYWNRPSLEHQRRAPHLCRVLPADADLGSARPHPPTIDRLSVAVRSPARLDRAAPRYHV